jgi:hypothetical protein
MSDFAQEIAAWQPFFMTLATVCATLAGLLFVALSLHPGHAHEKSRGNLQRLAQHTFSDFVQVLFIGVFYSVPLGQASFYGLATLIIVVLGLREVWERFIQTWRGGGDEPHRSHFIRRMGLSLLGRVLLTVGSLELVFQAADHAELWNQMMYIFSGALVLLMAGLRNAWFLMLQELE